MKDRTYRIVGWSIVVMFTTACWWFMLKPAFAASPTFTFKFHVETRKPSNVVVRYKLTCSNSTTSRTTAERFEEKTPFTSTVAQNLLDPIRCDIRVVAWDIQPWVGPHGNGDTPVVTSWVIRT